MLLSHKTVNKESKLCYDIVQHILHIVRLCKLYRFSIEIVQLNSENDR